LKNIYQQIRFKVHSENEYYLMSFSIFAENFIAEMDDGPAERVLIYPPLN